MSGSRVWAAMRSPRFRAVVLCILVVLLVWHAGVRDVFSVAYLRSARLQLLAFIRAHHAPAAVLFVMVYVAVCAAMLPVTAVMMFAAGVLFGFSEGLMLTVLGATCGAGAAFLVSRHLLGSWLQRRFAAQLAAFNREFAAHGVTYLLTMRFIPVFPFWMINLLAGCTRMPLGEFLWTTAVGVLPSAAVFVFLGGRMAHVRSLREALSAPTLLALAVPGVFALVPVLMRRVRSTRTSGNRPRRTDHARDGADPNGGTSG